MSSNQKSTGDDSSSSDSEDIGVQVRISLRLASSVLDRSLEVPTDPIAVPADIGRKGLSAVLNHLLGRVAADDDNDEKSSSDDDDDDDDNEKRPALSFEFILGTSTKNSNRLLRKGVEREARQLGTSLEEAIPITYFPASPAPEVSDDDKQLPDWVSCLDGVGTSIVSGCYDGSIHVFQRRKDGSMGDVGTVNSASGPIKALSVMEDEHGGLILASASLDHSLNIHSYQATTGIIEQYGQCSLNGTSGAFSSLSFAKSSSQLLASGDSNGNISIWTAQSRNGENIDTTKETLKKRKTSKSKVSQHEISATTTMTLAHSQSVSGLSWGTNASNETHLISSSWDHSIKLWDVVKQDCLLTLNGSRVVSCIDASHHAEGVIASGHPDCTVRLWDVRVNPSSSSDGAMMISDSTFRPSHKAWISAVKWSKNSAYQVASTSHDGTVKLWDIRSSSPLHTVRAFPKEEKGLCLFWQPPNPDSGSTQSLFAGGTDSLVKQIDF